VSQDGDYTFTYDQIISIAISYTHTCAAFAGGFLLRMARLFPHDFDLGQTCTLVESVAQLLSEGKSDKRGCAP
jgi:hypothetical protein